MLVCVPGTRGLRVSPGEAPVAGAGSSDTKPGFKPGCVGGVVAFVDVVGSHGGLVVAHRGWLHAFGMRLLLLLKPSYRERDGDADDDGAAGLCLHATFLRIFSFIASVASHAAVSGSKPAARASDSICC